MKQRTRQMIRENLQDYPANLSLTHTHKEMHADVDDLTGEVKVTQSPNREARRAYRSSMFKYFMAPTRRRRRKLGVMPARKMKVPK